MYCHPVLDGMARKYLTHIPFSHKPGFSGISASTEKLIKIAKKAPVGFVRRVTKHEAIEISSKYKFKLPNKRKPIKHLSSTGIELIRKGPNFYYIIKPA
jgi:hypothetical protein